MEGCIFCSIAGGSIPAEIVYTDDHVVAFRDINPAAPVHILLIPREHIASYNDLEERHDKLIGHMALVIKKIAAEQGLAEQGYRVLANCGPDAGQVVYHLHYHLLGGRPLAAW